jgi:hypothetical protein
MIFPPVTGGIRISQPQPRPLLQGLPGIPKNMKVHPDRLDTMSGNSRREDVLGYQMRLGDATGPTDGPERHSAGLPAERIGEHSGRRHKSSDVFRNIKRLDHKLGIHTGGIAPTRHLNVHFAVVLFGCGIIPGKYAENRRGLQMQSGPARRRSKFHTQGCA